MGNAEPFSRPLKIKGAFTWHTGSHQLFDYDNNNQAETIIYPLGSGFLQRKGLELHFVTHEERDWETIFYLQEARNRLIRIMDGKEAKQQGEQLWMVLQPKHSFILNPGDALKLGKIIVTVKEIVLRRDQNQNTIAETKMADTHLDIMQTHSISSGVSKRTGAPQCRFCFDPHDTEQDPLISPCSCSGTLGDIHLNCLKTWLQNKITKRISDISYSYNWGRLKCEICGGRFEETYQKHGRQYWVLPFVHKPEPPYIILQSSKIHSHLEDEESVVYITQLQQNFEVKIGRDTSQHIRINDISVSRNHCSLNLVQGKLMVCDKSSKFGTLMRFRSTTTIPLNNLSLQYGRTNIQVSREGDLFECCLECIEGQQFELFGTYQ